MRILPNCKATIQEFRRYKYPKPTEPMKPRKHDHDMDMVRYFIVNWRRLPKRSQQMNPEDIREAIELAAKLAQLAYWCDDKMGVCEYGYPSGPCPECKHIEFCRTEYNLNYLLTPTEPT